MISYPRCRSPPLVSARLRMFLPHHLSPDNAGDSPLWGYFWKAHACRDVAVFRRFAALIRRNYGVPAGGDPTAGPPHEPRVLIISRKDVGTREIDIEGETAEWLRGRGIRVEVLQMGSLTFAEQVRRGATRWDEVSVLRTPLLYGGVRLSSPTVLASGREMSQRFPKPVCLPTHAAPRRRRRWQERTSS